MGEAKLAGPAPATGVDLSSGTCGVVTFADGEKFFCQVVEPYHDADYPGAYRVRIESGWSCLHGRDGRQLCSGVVVRVDGTREDVRNDNRNIVRYEPMTYDDHRAKGLPGHVCP